MKYMEKGGFQKNPLMKLTLMLTLLFLVGLWCINFILVFQRMGFSPTSVAEYYRGSEENFIVARSAMSMLETTHMHLPVMAIVILLLTHLLIFAPFKPSVKVGFIVATFLSAFLGETAGWLVRFISPHFAYLKLGCFFVFQGMLAFLIFGLAWFLMTSHSKTTHHHST